MCKFTGIYWLLGFWDLCGRLCPLVVPLPPPSLWALKIFEFVSLYLVRGLFPLEIPSSPLPPTFLSKTSKIRSWNSKSDLENKTIRRTETIVLLCEQKEDQITWSFLMTRLSKHNYTSLLDIISGNQRKYYVVRML